MSTKCSLAYGDSFHLYQECFDQDNIYLELESVEYEREGCAGNPRIPNRVVEAAPERVMVSIPIAI